MQPDPPAPPPPGPAPQQPPYAPPPGYGPPAPGYGPPPPGYGVPPGYPPPWQYGGAPGGYHGPPPGAPGSPWPPYRPATPNSAGSPWAVVAAVLVGLWTVAVTLPTQGIGWLVDQVLLATGTAQPGWLWPTAALLNALLVGTPAVLLAVLPRSPAVRAAGRLWLLAAALLALFGLLRAIPMPHHEAYLAALAGAAALAAPVVRRIVTRRERSRPAAAPPPTATAAPGPTAGDSTPPQTADTAPSPVARAGRGGSAARWYAVAAGLALLLPWVWVGALGGPLETGLALVAAAALGWLASALFGDGFWRAYGRDGTGRPVSAVRAVLLGGLVAGVGLALLAAGVGQAGTQLAELALLPPAGFALAALALAGTGGAAAQPAAQPAAQFAARSAAIPSDATRSGRSGPAGWLVGIGVLGPLALVDPEEISLMLATGRDVPFWVLVASGAGLMIALLLGAALLIRAALLGRPRPGDAARPEASAAQPEASATRPRASAAQPEASAAQPEATATTVARPGRGPSRRLAGALVVLLLLATGAVYTGLGQPGWHGERLFVVLAEQADLTGVKTDRFGPAARDARTREVYRRLVSTAERTQAGLRRDLDRFRLDYTPYYLVNAVEVTGGPAIRQWLSRRADVDRVLLSQQLRPLPAGLGTASGDEPAPSTPPWNITMIGADRVRTQLGVDGSGIVVGTSDSGVDAAHPALTRGFRGGDDSWHDPWNASRSPADHSGHGTHTLATAVGAQNVGVAPGAQWVGCVNLDRNLGNPARYLDCLQFMLAPYPPGGDPFTDGRPERAPHVLTNSWGCPPVEGCDARSLQPATNALTAAGIFFVAAAGNTGPSCDTIVDPPAPYADVLTVGAVNQQRRVADFSSRGPAPGGAQKPDVVAPGAGVLSAMPGGGYASLDGTSMAAPHVAGVVALLWSANPNLIGDVAGTARILRDTAVALPVPAVQPGLTGQCQGTGANVTGTGLVDAYAAVRAAGPPA